MKTSEFIERANKVHHGKFTYKIDSDNVLLKNNITIVCPIHGEMTVNAYEHLKGRDCRKCSYIKRGIKKTNSKEDFIQKSLTIHGNKYDYSKVEYVNSSTKVCIICPEHGEFWQTPNAHLRGEGCPECGRIKSKKNLQTSTDEFIVRARKVHGNKYDYSYVNYVNNKTKIKIICPIHGVIYQTPAAHLRGCGCPKCRYEKTSQTQTLTTDEFIERARKIHGEKYDYSKVVYRGYETYVKIICPIHGEFEQTPDSHLHSLGCPKCGGCFSIQEDNIYDYVKSLISEEEIIRHDRKTIYPHELDLYIPSRNIAIEYDGLYWHSSSIKEDINYHLNKTIECERKNIHLIHIFEDEWLYHEEIVKSKIKHLLKCDNDLPKIFGRKCAVKEISVDEARFFLNENHIQGFTRSSIHIGCFYQGKLIGVMNFMRERKDKNIWELNRFATNWHYLCIGIGGKLFQYFVNKYKPIRIKSFADRRWSTRLFPTIYDKLGFTFEKYTSPDYSYFIPNLEKNKRIHKFDCRKNILHKKFGLSLSMTESEMTNQLHFYKIWNCGLIKYIWENSHA